MDLVREILLELEEKPFNVGWVDLEIPNYTDEIVSYHVMLLAQADLIEAQDVSDVTARNWKPKWLTWQGHEFLEAARDETRWNQAKALMKEKTGGVVFEVLRDTLISLAKKAILGTTGFLT